MRLFMCTNKQNKTKQNRPEQTEPNRMSCVFLRVLALVPSYGLVCSRFLTQYDPERKQPSRKIKLVAFSQHPALRVYLVMVVIRNSWRFTCCIKVSADRQKNTEKKQKGYQSTCVLGAGCKKIIHGCMIEQVSRKALVRCVSKLKKLSTKKPAWCEL